MRPVAHNVQQILGGVKNERARILELRLKMLGKKVSRPEQTSLAIFLRSLSLLLGCGIRLNSALTLLSRQGDDLMMRSVAIGLAEEVTRGNSLSLGMSCFPNAFDDFHISLVQVGERTGNLEKVLAQLADNEEKASALTMKVKSALTYPAFVFIIGTLMLIFGPPYLFGGIIPILRGQGIQLPLITLAFIAFSDAVRNPFVVVGMAFAAYAFGRLCIRLWTQPSSAMIIRTKLLEVPYLGRALRTLAVCRMANSFALQMDVGCDVVDILRSSARASQDIVLESRIEQAVTRLKAGKTLSESLISLDYFPGLFLSVLKVGEETGEVALLMRRITHLYEQEIDTAVDTMVSLLEPLIMLFMGSVVGVMLLAVMLPMARMISNL